MKGIILVGGSGTRLDPLPKQPASMKPLILDEVLELAATTLPAAGVTCLLIGGFAVNHYGYTRNTLDIDFMIAANRADTLRPIMQAAGFTNVSVLDNVIFFGKPGSPLRVDFLRVDAQTMQRLEARAITATLHGQTLRLPALADLLAMKIFALAQAAERRIDKDLPDIAYLCVLNDVDVEREIRPLCHQYASDTLYQQIREKIRGIQP